MKRVRKYIVRYDSITRKFGIHYFINIFPIHHPLGMKQTIIIEQSMLVIHNSERVIK